MKRTLLLDVDTIIYVAAGANEYTAQFDEDLWVRYGHFDQARAMLDGDIRDLKEKLEADVVVMALTSGKNPWRREILPTYKSNRKNTMPPLLIGPLRDYVRERYGNHVIERPGLEADDILGILLTSEGAPDPVVGERVLCSIDKDMKSIPGLHYNWRKDEDDLREPVSVTVEEADRFHMVQTLTGDTTDGYKGCPGVGPKSAEKILGDSKAVTEMWPKVVSAYEKAGLSAEEALTQARVARICRAADFNFKEKKVIPWAP